MTRNDWWCVTYPGRWHPASFQIVSSPSATKRFGRRMVGVHWSRKDPVADPWWGSCLSKVFGSVDYAVSRIWNSLASHDWQSSCVWSTHSSSLSDRISVATTQGVRASESGLIYRLCAGPKRPVFPIKYCLSFNQSPAASGGERHAEV